MSADRKLEDAIVSLTEELAGEPAVLTGWVLITEWAAEEPILGECSPERQGYWRTLGMLQASHLNLLHTVPTEEDA